MHGRRLVLRGGACALAWGLAACTSLQAPDPRADDRAVAVASTWTVEAVVSDVAACLRDAGGRVSYPGGIGPQSTTVRQTADGAIVTQWFFLRHGGRAATHYRLRPAGDAATRVDVLLPTELTAAAGYRRAADELLALCGGQAQPSR